MKKVENNVGKVIGHLRDFKTKPPFMGAKMKYIIINWR